MIEQQHPESHKKPLASARIRPSSSSIFSQEYSQNVSRAPSRADSSVDSWTPTLAGRRSILERSAKSPTFYTAPLNNEHGNNAGDTFVISPPEGTTLRLAHSVSWSRTPSSVMPEGIGNNSARGSLACCESDTSTEPPQDAYRPWEQTLRTSWSFSEDSELERCSSDDLPCPNSPISVLQRGCR